MFSQDLGFYPKYSLNMLKMRKFRKIQVDDLKKKNQYKRVVKVKIVFSHLLYACLNCAKYFINKWIRLSP